MMLKIHRQRRHGRDSGYMLLVLMLAVAVLTISLVGVAFNYKRTIQRDREVEMIHRGEQYERAVRRFYIKNNRYPVSLEQLENMNKIRYLRKRYKDPMSPDGEWKVAHAGDVKLTTTVTQPAPGTAGANSSNPNAVVDGSQPTQDAGSSAAAVSQGQDAGTASGGGTGTGNAGGSAFGSNGNSAFGNSNAGNAGSTTAQNGSAFGNSGGGNNAANGQVLGGGDILGVVSKSKKKGFHIYGEKEKYNEWFFVYDPSMDKGQLLVGPYNPKMFVGSANSGLNSGKGPTGTGTGTGGNQGTTNVPSGNPPSTTTTPQPNQ